MLRGNDLWRVFRRPPRRPVIVTLALAGGLLGGGSVAGAQPVQHATATWKVTNSLNVTGATGTRLNGVSCPTSTSCFAVGYSYTGAPSQSFVEHWDGLSWTILDMPVVAGLLNAVSCPTSTSCFAIGVDENYGTLAERWDGSTWAVMDSPSAPDAYNHLLAISCRTATSCFAVGDYQAFSGVARSLIEHWDGTTWTIQPSPNPAGSTFASLLGVSCVTTNSCFAAGYYTSGSSATFKHRSVIERWNGRTWSVAKKADPRGGTYLGFSAVSCPSPHSCFAVGTYQSGGVTTLIEHWNGAAWSVMKTPPGFANPNGVSCPNTTSCFAVGFGSSGTLVDHWNGRAWSTMQSPDPPGAKNVLLNGVSCANTKTCIAVGNYSTKGGLFGGPPITLAERYG